MFILATTDPEKIIETIKSRCFQIFFDPIPAEKLFEHLQKICDAESIVYDHDGLMLLVQQSGGSARDALTMLERVALASDNKVTGECVSNVLGLIGKELITHIYSLIKENNSQELRAVIKNNRYDAYALWKELTEHIRKSLYDVQNAQDYERTLRHLKISYHTEPLLAKTSMADAVVEYMLLSMCTPAPILETTKSEPVKSIKEPLKATKPAAVQVETKAPMSQPWDQFIDALKNHAEPDLPVAPAHNESSKKPLQKLPTQKPSTQSQTVSQALKIFPGTIQEV